MVLKPVMKAGLRVFEAVAKLVDDTELSEVSADEVELWL